MRSDALYASDSCSIPADRMAATDVYKGARQAHDRSGAA